MSPEMSKVAEHLADLAWMAVAEICQDHEAKDFHYDSGHRAAIVAIMEAIEPQIKECILAAYPKIASFWNERDGYPKGSFDWETNTYEKGEG